MLAKTSLFLMLISALLLAGCTRSFTTDRETQASADQPIVYTDLPDGIGRGYPVAHVEKGKRRNANLALGSPAPDFAMQLRDGRTLHLSDLHGRPVMINFWATWCLPCRIEMPDIVEQASINDDLVVIAANVQEEVNAIKPFAEEYGMVMPILLDTDGTLRDRYLIRGMPTSVFIDHEGNIASVWEGPLSSEQLEAQLDRIQ